MRLNDTYLGAIAMAPKAVASATLTTTGFVDVSGVPEVTFLIATGALTKGKKLTVQLVASDVAEGTGAVQIAEQAFTAEEALTGGAVAVVSYLPTAAHGRYVGIKLKHDAGSDVNCSVTAMLRQRMTPAENGWAVNC